MTSALPEVLEKLESCPFCGGEAMDRPVSPQFWTVSCTQCQTEGPPFASQTEAITAWNTRPALLRDAGDGAARPLDDWHEDYGSCVWWTWENGQWLGEPAWIGGPLDSDWPGYHTHFTRHPTFPQPPAMHAPGGG